MANHKATKKDMRQSAKRRERNKYYGKTTRNAIRDLKVVEAKAEAGVGGGQHSGEEAAAMEQLPRRG